MPKKTTKSAEPKAKKSKAAAKTGELSTPVPESATEVALDKEAEHRMQAESPAVPEDAEAEAEALAAETNDDAFEGAEIEAEPNAEAAAEESEAEDEEADSAGEVSEDEDAEDEDAELDSVEGEESDDEEDSDFTPAPRPPAKLERLQKILARAGVASRRRAEELIEQGRVQVNGKIVTELGTKADAGRDHIRVDGKLLHGAERQRYFVLNKPKGYVTTVKDPEGRSTVMEFFAKMPERLYPVGRLDYQSEGLLLVTNDGELANKLTKAASGVEKTYLGKGSGQPSEAELDILRGGVSIERGKPGEGRVRTSPARIRQVRQGDNPWYEVVLIEGRNRELRKMFEEIGHFVEKIRRTGYGPLVLHQEPRHLRRLEPEGVGRGGGWLVGEDKLPTPKSKNLRRRNLLDAGLLPTVLPKPSSRPRQAVPLAKPPVAASRLNPDRPSDYRPKKFGSARPTRAADSFASGEANKFFRPARPSAERFRPAAGRTSAPNPVRSFSRTEEERPSRTGTGSTTSFGFNRPAGRSFDRPDSRPAARPAARPAWKKDDRTTRPPARFAEGSTGEARPAPSRPFSPKPAWKKPERPDRSDRPARPERSARPDFKRSAPPRREAPAREARVFDEDLGPVRPPNLHIEEITGPDRPSAPRPRPVRPSDDRPSTNRSSFNRPARAEGTRPSTTSSGKPRAGGARPSSKPGAFAKAGPGWKPKSSFNPGKPASGTRSKPKPGSSAKPSHRVKPGGKRPTGKPAGKKRNY